MCSLPTGNTKKVLFKSSKTFQGYYFHTRWSDVTLHEVRLRPYNKPSGPSHSVKLDLMSYEGFAKKTFKRVLRTSLLNILQNEDDCIQIPVIIKKVGEVD